MPPLRGINRRVLLTERQRPSGLALFDSRKVRSTIAVSLPVLGKLLCEGEKVKMWSGWIKRSALSFFHVGSCVALDEVNDCENAHADEIGEGALKDGE